MGMLANRLRKNMKHLAKWARTQGVECYRLYQQDIPEYPVIVEKYGDCAVAWLNERKRDDTDDAKQAYVAQVQAEIAEALDLGAGRLFCKQRRPGGQYRRQQERPFWQTVTECGLQFAVNLSSYHDTGLFLDHRPTRRLVREQAQGRDVLNLFCYTGSFTVYAAAGAARSTTSVDLSGTYLDWLDRNLILNKLGGDHLLVQSDVLEWLDRAAEEGRRFDLIVCDPPTFSNSKRTAGLFDVVHAHPQLIERSMALLQPGGVLIFSTNKRGFSLSADVSQRWDCRDITAATTDPDFAGRIHHQAWQIRRHRV